MFGSTVLAALSKLIKGPEDTEHSEELAEQLVSLVDRLESDYPEHDLSVLRDSDDVCLAYIEACRAYLASPSRSKRKLRQAAWNKLDVDGRWELEELAFWQTDVHRIKSLLSLASSGEFCPTGYQFEVDLRGQPMNPPQSRSAEVRHKPRKRTVPRADGLPGSHHLTATDDT